MTTILGQHISLVRPSKPHQCRVYKDELPVAKRQSITKTIKEHCGKVAEVCVMLSNGAIRGKVPPATHIDVLEVFDISPENVKATGWQLENGNYIWR
jgi:hypothetical protein